MLLKVSLSKEASDSLGSIKFSALFLKFEKNAIA